MLAKKCFFMGILTLFSLSLAIADPPAVHPTTGEPLVIDCFRGTPDAIDGDLSDWNLGAMTPAVLDAQEQLSSDSANTASWDSPEDSSGEFYLLWDDENIYIAVVMKDDKLSQNKSGGDIWNADAVEVFFATTDAIAAHTSTIHYQYGFDFKEQRWNWCNMDTGGGVDPDYLQIASSETPDGYILEASIEHGQMLSLDFSVGNTIGFHPVFDDTDNGDRELQMTWTGLAAHDQSQGFGYLVLSGAAVIPGPSSSPSPISGAMLEDTWVNLSWRPGIFAVSHDIYIGDNFDDVNDGAEGTFRGNQAEAYLVAGFPGFAYPDGLIRGTTYYWRIDEVNDTEPNSPWKGEVWSFKIANYLVVDDFEDYNDYPPDDIFSTWIDGYGVATNGALVGNDTPPFAEQSIVHSGAQSIPYFYDNIGTANYSEAERTFSPAEDWTRESVKVLSLWFKGYPAYMGSFVEGPTGTFTMTAEGVDIWDTSDQFHFAYKELSGAGTIIAKVESVENTHEWAKAGVMIRDTLDADSRYAMMVVTPAQGVSFQRRTTTGGNSSSDTEAGITATQWVKLERTVGGLVRAYYSADGSTWTQLSTPQTVTMNMPMYVGLALTSHNSGVACEAKFSNVSFPGTTVGQQWTNQDIGITTNDAEPMYVALNGSAVVYHDDLSAAQIATWTEWRIDLQDFAAQGVNLANVNSIAIGFGDKNNLQAGGSGMVFFDDVRLYRPAQ